VARAREHDLDDALRPKGSRVIVFHGCRLTLSTIWNFSKMQRRFPVESIASLAICAQWDF
jgi:hypothetical protein